MPPSVQDLVDAASQGDKLALARLLTHVEKNSPDVPAVLHLLYPKAGNGYRVGFTGPPGGGKSTMVDQVTKVLRARDDAPAVGIIAVDPTSPFSGGAILGDRIRMQQHYKDEGVFVRSMATRGSHGGLPGVASRAATVMEASGKDYILLETVGVGQTELDIMEVADTVIVVLVPEAGDSVQTMKAGLMEIADIFVVNKADRDGADKLSREISSALHLSPKQSWWDVPIFLTQAHKGEGILEVTKAVERHRKALSESGNLEAKRQRRGTMEFFKTVEENISTGLHGLLAGNDHLQSIIGRIHRGEIDPYSAAVEVMRNRELLSTWVETLGG